MINRTVVLDNTASCVGMLGLCVVAMSMVVTSGCQKREPPPRAEAKPPAVRVFIAKSQDVPVNYEFIGQTEATRRVEIRARVPGFVVARDYTEGGPVKAGDVLFQLDRKPFEADLEVAKAELDEANAALKAAESDVARFTELLAADAGSQKEYDDAVASRSAAVARIRAAEAKIARSQLELGYTVITSPLTGVAGASKKDIGSYVDGSADSLLVEVIETDPIDVLFTVSEREIENTRRAEKEGRVRPPTNGIVQLELTLVDGSVYPHSGSVSFADIQVDPVTGTTRIRGEFPNPRGALRPGQFVRGIVKGYTRPGAVIVPRQAVLQSPAGATVLIVDGASVVQLRPVKLGEWIGSDVVVLTGVSAGDRVIQEGVQRVGPGLRVTVSSDETATPPQPAGSPKNRP